MIQPLKKNTRIYLINLLKEHEEIDPFHFYKLKKELVRDGFQKDPIIIEDKYNTVLDGHHRLNILKSLGLSKIAAYQVDYLNNAKIKVKTWYPIIVDSNTNPLDIFKKYFVNKKLDNMDEEYSKLLLKEGVHMLHLDRKKALGMIVGKIKLDYIDTEEKALEMIQDGRAKAALSFKPISKKEVIRHALSGNKLPPKTTQHKIPDRPKDWYIPFKELK